MTALMTNRLAPQPGEVILRDERFSFTWNGTAFPALAGDTIASALAACGVRVFSRSYKYHRPHGILTADYFEDEKDIPMTGRIGIQIHGGGKAEASYKDITIGEL